METLDGIPIFSAAELIKPVLDRYGRRLKDPAIRTDILQDIHRAVATRDIDALRLFLSQDNSRWVGNLQSAYFQPFEGAGPLDQYEDWARAKCDILVTIAAATREEDGIIQYILNYEDFHVEVLPLSFGPSFIVRLYELRGLDFF